MIAPKTETELAEVIASAKAPLRVVGGGTRPVGRPLQGTELSAAALSGIELYEPGALTLVAGAGTPLDTITATLAAENQRLAFEPMDHRPLLGTQGTPTIGGVVAANVSGPRRIQAGACRDFLLGVRFVDGAGTIIKNGGRVMKNVTGYDLARLMAGSRGTLGVLSQVAFKVLARPETEATLVAHGLGAAEGVAALSRALGSPFDVSGAAHLELDNAPARTQIRIEGMAGSVAYRTGRLLADLPGFKALEGEESPPLWREIRDVLPFAGAEGAVWRISVKPSDGPVLSRALSRAGQAHSALYDWGGGLVWLLVPEANHAGEAAIRTELRRLGGHATLVRAPAEIRGAVSVFPPEPAPLAAIAHGLRNRFDPRGILNPGLMG